MTVNYQKNQLKINITPISMIIVISQHTYYLHRDKIQVLRRTKLNIHKHFTLIIVLNTGIIGKRDTNYVSSRIHDLCHYFNSGKLIIFARDA